jgi:hypothetical protein
MTEIIIRDGVIETLPSAWNVLAWDSTRNNSTPVATNLALASYSTWSEFALSNDYNLLSTFNQNDASALPVTYNLPGTDIDGSVMEYAGMQAPVWTYNGDPIGPFSGVVGFGGVLHLSFTSVSVDVRQLLISIGSKTSGNEPSWAYASMNYWFDASNGHHYIECRVGITIKSVKVNGFTYNIPHLYVIYKDTFGNAIKFYVDDVEIASIPLLSTSDPEWSTVNQNDDLDSWWAVSDYGYIPTAGTVASAVNVYTLFVIDYSEFYINHAPLLQLCQYRYGIITDTHPANTSTTTLTGATIAIFDDSIFDSMFI